MNYSICEEEKGHAVGNEQSVGRQHSKVIACGADRHGFPSDPATSNAYR
jgi:hypothetical protein